MWASTLYWATAYGAALAALWLVTWAWYKGSNQGSGLRLTVDNASPVVTVLPIVSRASMSVGMHKEVRISSEPLVLVVVSVLPFVQEVYST